MTGPSLQKTTFLSAALHFVFFLLAVFVFRQTQKSVMPSPYEVTLVGQPSSSVGGRSFQETFESRSDMPVFVPEKVPDKSAEAQKADLKRLEEKMAELSSKKKVERIVKLRKMITVGGPTSSQKRSEQTAGGVSGKGQAGIGTYEDLIASHIGREIIFPDTGDTSLETIVLVRIHRDGEIKIQSIEKRSGNLLFDRAALRAIEKANPVPSPPAEMEIGLKLHPYMAQR